MIEMVIWLVVIAAFVFRALKQNGTLDELFAGAKKRKENKAERVVYEQPEEGSGKKEKKKGPGIRVPKHTGLAVTAVVIVLAAAVLSFDSFYTLSEEEMAVVTTFGKPAVEEASGLHFKIPVIQRVTKVSKAITGMQIGYTTDPARADGASIDNPVSIENESLMITKDFNLTNVDFYVEYMVTDPVQAVRHRSVYESIIKNLAQRYEGGCEFPEVIITNYDPGERERSKPRQLDLFGMWGDGETDHYEIREEICPEREVL